MHAFYNAILPRCSGITISDLARLRELLFSDTKLPEHFAEDFVGGDGVGGGGEDGVYVADGGAQVLGE